MDPTTSNSTAASESSPRGGEGPDIGDVINYVTTYAKQETLGPLKGAGRWMAFGTASAFALGIGLLLVLLGLLRLVQTEWEWAAEGSWSWMAYLVVLVACVAVLVVTLSRIKRDQLNKEPY